MVLCAKLGKCKFVDQIKSRSSQDKLVVCVAKKIGNLKARGFSADETL
jgi:hypothetical protein